jgi:hypothetical protein
VSKYYQVNPEVAGGLGPETVMDRSVHPPRVTRLHYEVIDWLGDCIVQTFPCFLVVRTTADRIESAEFSGFSLSEAIVSEASEFREINPDGELPDLVWLVVDGAPGVDDFGTTERGQLVVSESVLDILRSDTLNTGSFSPWVSEME